MTYETRRSADRKTTAHRQSLFGNDRAKSKVQTYAASLPSKFWDRIEDPVRREAARQEYEILLLPPALLSSDGITRLDNP